MARYIMTTEEFIKRSIERHGDKYKYDQSVYVDQQTKVKIFCRACDRYFEQKPQKHYGLGEGCWDCGVSKRAKTRTMSFEEFTSKAQQKHGKQYEYDVTTYTMTDAKVTIRCRKCMDVFEQRANAHLQGAGCPRCSTKRAHAKQSYGGDGFIQRAKEVHGEKFTYLGCTDPNWTQKSTITWQCRDCELVRDQLVLNHLAGKGCPRCSKVLRHTLESFIAKAESVHGKGRYDYSKIEKYVANEHVIITCCTCQFTWKTRPDNHMEGRGCPNCVAKRYVSKAETEWLDSLDIDPACRNQWLVVDGRKFNVDALVDRTVYEFDGDYYHGNPAKFPSDKMNHKCGLTMGELHQNTLEKHKFLRDAGYDLVTIWESEWNERNRKRRRGTACHPARVLSVPTS